MRKISNTLAMENLYANVPSSGDPSLPSGGGSSTLKAFSEKVLRPHVKVVTEDCLTRLGTLLQTDKDVIGRTPLRDLTTGGTDNTTIIPEGNLIYQVDLENLNGILKYSQHSSIRVRGLETCTAVTSTGTPGVCSKCLRASAEYTYSMTFPKPEDIVDFAGTSQPSYFYLESVEDDVRQTYVIYYGHGVTDIPPWSASVVEAPTTASSSLPIQFIRVVLNGVDTPSTVAGKTAEALEPLLTSQGFSTFKVVHEGDTVKVKHTVYQTSVTTNSPYMNGVGTPYAIPGLDILVNFNGYTPGTSLKLDQHSVLGFYSRVIESYGGSLLGMQQIVRRPLPFREELFRSIVSENDVAIAYRELTKSLGNKIPTDMIQYISEVPDRLDRALLIIAVYTVYSYVG